MILEHILKNILYYFLPIVIPSTIAVIASEKIHQKRKIIFLGNSLLFIFIIVFSLVTRPPGASLEVELAFYALREGPGGSYELRSLIGAGIPSLLGIDLETGKIKGVPVVHSGEQFQMRLKLNRKAYMYIFQVYINTASPDLKSELRQRFPSEKPHQLNPVSSDGWLEVPSTDGTWRFGQKPGIEIFLVYVSTRSFDGIKGEIERILEKTRNLTDRETILESLQQSLRALAPCLPKTSGMFEHNLKSVIPGEVKTYSYQAQNGKTALLCQFIRHAE